MIFMTPALRADEELPLLRERRRVHHHAMTPEDLRHLGAIGRATGGGIDYFRSLPEVCGAHYRRGYDSELFYILVTEIIKAVQRASRDTKRLPGTDVDWRAVNRPGQDTLDTVEDFFVGDIPVGWRHQLLPGGNENLEHRHAAVGIIARKEKPDPQRANLDDFFRRIDSGRTLLHRHPHCEQIRFTYTWYPWPDSMANLQPKQPISDAGFVGAEGGNRTRTPLARPRILSPVRLPVSPPRHAE